MKVLEATRQVKKFPVKAKMAADRTAVADFRGKVGGGVTQKDRFMSRLSLSSLVKARRTLHQHQSMMS